MSSAAPVRMLVVMPLRSGLQTVECWGNSADCEIVTHEELRWDGPVAGQWALTHRRSGLCIRNVPPFSRQDLALQVAALLDRLPAFKGVKVERIEDGPVDFGVDQQRALRADVERVVREWRTRLRSADARDPVPS